MREREHHLRIIGKTTGERTSTEKRRRRLSLSETFSLLYISVSEHLEPVWGVVGVVAGSAGHVAGEGGCTGGIRRDEDGGGFFFLKTSGYEERRERSVCVCVCLCVKRFYI
ncbi:hypothetical protein HanRHA438_Chr07g0309721 [Helianthus annuus]|nr:hypothetical protein HanRHA438_Chr07g0309721 [Helianthus annuus]